MDEKAVRALAAVLKANKVRSQTLRRFKPLEQPHNNQKKALTSSADVIVILGGNGSGKTLTCLVHDCYHLTGWYPSWYPNELRMSLPVSGRIVAPSYLVVREVIEPYLLGNLQTGEPGLLPPNLIPPPYGTNKSASLIKGQNTRCFLKYYLGNGSTLDIISLDQKINTMESVERDFVHYEEPIPRVVYDANQSRIFRMKRRGRAHGRSWIGLTPLEESSGVNPVWIWRDLVRPWQSSGISSGYDVHYLWTEENTYLGKDAIEAFKRDVKEQHRKSRLYGDFIQLSGIIYDIFDRKYHLIDPIDVSKGTHYLGLDYHIRKTSAVWMSVLPHDLRVIYKTIKVSNLTTSMAAELIHTNTRYPVYACYGDCNPRSTTTGDVERDEINFELSKLGCPVYILKPKKNECSISKCYDSLVVDPEAIHPYNDVKGSPDIFIFNTCNEFIDEILNWSWDSIDYGNPIMSSRLGNAEKTEHHILDAWRYLMGMPGGPRYFEREESSNLRSLMVNTPRYRRRKNDKNKSNVGAF